MKRRTFFLASLAAAVATAFALKPKRFGESHNDYYGALNQELKKDSQFKPTMLIDLDRMDQNIDALKSILNPAAKHRIPVKSLPSMELMKYIMKRAKTDRLMVFHQPFLNTIALEIPSSDVLIGKPLPVGAANHFYKTLDSQNEFKHESQLQWLIDSSDRLKQYLQLAQKLGVRMRINIEIDVGLHRGGIDSTEQLYEMLDIIAENSERLTFSGFMGYDPQIVKLPAFIKKRDVAYQESQAVYKMLIDALAVHPSNIEIDSLCFNGSGSPTLELHKSQTVCNDLSAGSCLVKPTDFDLDTLTTMSPASFIATPVLKKQEGTTLPGIESASRMFGAWNPNRADTFFIYGGKWMADYESPKGLIKNEMMGESTNQSFVNGPKELGLEVDDFVFLRPTQSEFVFLQFGAIQTIRNGRLAEQWPVFTEST